MPRTKAKPGPAAVLIGVYAVIVYLFFLLVLVYSIGFFIGYGVPKAIDDGSHGCVPVAIIVDVALLNLFAGQHTVMARPWFKRAWTRIVPEAAERATFVLAASAILALLCWQWRPIGGTVWQLDGWAAAPVLIVYVIGWLVAIASTYLINHADLFGLMQAWCRLRGVPYQPPPFTERGLYRHVRHPLMLGFLIVFWAAPVMSAGHLLFAISSTGYILVGIAFEERDLVRSLGARYVDYRKRVPSLLPIPGNHRQN